jgi:formiminotetrahydrofolate cyclodeaminase
MKAYLTERTIRDFIKIVSDEHYLLPGAVIAASAAQATALGEACMQISLENQVDTLDWQDVTARIQQMVHIKNTLFVWIDQDALALVEYNTAISDGSKPGSRKVLAEGPLEMTRLILAATKLLREFQPLAFQKLKEKSMVAVYLLIGAAQAAVHLTDTRLQEWGDPDYFREYNPVVAQLKQQIEELILVEFRSNK